MNVDAMNDDEILEAILEGFGEDGRLSMNYLDVEVVDGSITISGRVSSEEELQIIREIMRDTLEIEDYKNNVWVDETLSYEDHEDNESPDLKELDLEDSDIDDEEYDDEEEEEN